MGVDFSEAHLGDGLCCLQRLAVERDVLSGPVCVGLTLCLDPSDLAEEKGHGTDAFSPPPLMKPEQVQRRPDTESKLPLGSPTKSF